MMGNVEIAGRLTDELRAGEVVPMYEDQSYWVI